MIEPIADSTLYPAYFPIRTLVADGEIPESALTDAFFDFVILGEGSGEPSLPKATLDRARALFQYWYPLDLNIAGKEHKRVHFPVFLATHALLLPPTLQPLGLLMHGWLTAQGGAKISKKEVSSKGGAIPPLRDAFEKWGADALRLFYATSASPSQDVDWDPALADAATERLEDLARLARAGLSEGGGGPPELERWLESRAHDILARVAPAFEEGRMRDAAEALYAELPGAIRRYLVRGGEHGPTLARVTQAWIAAIGPITPHLAEELGDGQFTGLVAVTPFPRPEEFPRSATALAAEEVIDRLEEDLRSVLKPAIAKGNPPGEAVLFVAAPWKRTVEAWIREGAVSPPGAPNLRELMERAQKHPELAAYLGEIAKYAGRVAPTIRSEPAPPPDGTDDLAILHSAQGYLLRRFRLRSIEIVREEEGGPLDPKGRRDRARPGRPAFYLFGEGATERPPSTSPSRSPEGPA